ncbi:MAG: outer membrane protein [Gemmatimonadales bacterium]
MAKRVLSLAALGALALVAAPKASEAQVSVTPFVGYYAPLGTLLQDGGTEFSTQSAMVFGGRLGLQTPGPLGFEASLAYSSAGLESGGAELDGDLMVLSGRALYRLGGLGPSGTLHAGAGLAYVMRGGDAWDGLEDSGIEGIDDFGGTIGLGAKFSFSPMMSIRVDVEDFIYSGEVHNDTEATESKLQNDLMLSAGLNFGF